MVKKKENCSVCMQPLGSSPGCFVCVAAKRARGEQPKPVPHALAGRVIADVRPMTNTEAEENGWELDGFDGIPAVLVLDNGTRLYASCDREGNRPGALFGNDAAGSFSLAFVPPRKRGAKGGAA